MVWPYLWAMCASMGLASLAANKMGPFLSLLSVMAACVTTKLASYTFDGGVYLSLGALIWATTATTVFRLGSATPSGIILLSALCYVWASVQGAAIEVGSIPFVVSDALMIVAMLWIGWGGIVSLVGRVLYMGSLRRRNIRVYSSVFNQVAEKKEVT